MRRPLDPPRGEDPVGIAVDQQRQHQPRVVLRLAGALPVHLERTKADTLDSLDDEMRKIVLRDPLAQIRRQQKLLTPVVSSEIHHANLLNQFAQIRQTASRVVESVWS